MRSKRTLERILQGCCVLAALAAGCAPAANGGAAKTAAVEQALTVIDCQNQASTCLGTMPSPDKITACRMEMQSCLSQAQMDQQSQASALGQCASDAAKCGQSAKSFADAMSCRQSFQDCVSKVVQLPAPPTTPPPPSFPMLPQGAGGPGGGSAGAGGGPGGGLSGANECRQAALQCVQAAKSPGDVATCNGDYRKCITALLPATPPPPPSGGGAGGPDVSKLQTCQQAALSCVQAAKGAADVAKCNDTYRSCVGLPAPPAPPSFPGGGFAGRAGGGFAGIGGGGIPGGGTDCLQALGQCLLTGGSPMDCASKARTCAGLPSPMLPTPSFPGVPAPPH